MMDMHMTARRFRDIVEAYGADPRRWPAIEREAAQAYVAADTQAQAWLEDARALDALLSADVIGPVSDRLQFQTVARMIAANDVVGTMPVRTKRLPMVWAAGASLAACLAGAVLGVNLSLNSLDDMRAQAVLEQVEMIDDIDLENG